MPVSHAAHPGPDAGGTSVTDLRGPAGAPDARFRLVARKATLRLASGRSIEALTFDGRSLGDVPDDERVLDGRWRMAAELAEKHPDVTKIGWRFSHWQHMVDYGPWYGNQLRLRPGVERPDEPNQYGMRLERIDSQTGKWTPQASPWYPWEDGR